MNDLRVGDAINFHDTDESMHPAKVIEVHENGYFKISVMHKDRPECPPWIGSLVMMNSWENDPTMGWSKRELSVPLDELEQLRQENALLKKMLELQNCLAEFRAHHILLGKEVK
jgi:hypothetical protein